MPFREQGRDFPRRNAFAEILRAAIPQSFGSPFRATKTFSFALVATTTLQAAPLFERLAPEHSGVTFRYQWTPPEKYDHEMVNATTGGGACAGDFDGDGLADLFLTQPFAGNRLYRNKGSFTFEDITDMAGLSEQKWGTGASFADVDNDGDLDLYVCGYDCANRFYLNKGEGTFRECAAEAGLAYRGASVMIAFADYDNDGDLDAYLLNNHIAPKEAPLWKYDTRRSDGMPLLPDELKGVARVLYRPDIGEGKLIPAGERDRLFRNDGTRPNGIPMFTDVTAASGLDDEFFGLGVVWFDHNEDGWPDLYVSNDFWGPDLLYRNNGDGTFTNITLNALPHTPWFSMGCDVADLNNDGHLDLMASDMSGTTHYKQKISMGDMQGWFLTYSRPLQYMRNALYLNTGTGRFLEVSHLAGVASTDWTWSLKFGDLDNDGREDLFVSNGAERFWDNSDLMADARGAQRIDTPELKALWLPQPKRDDPNLAFRNRGDLEFESVGEAWGLGDKLVSYGVAFADFDNDGDLDLVTNNFDDHAAVYRNGGNANHGLRLRLRGTKSNRDGIGARVEATAGDQKWTRYLTLARGFMSANEPRVHLGIGKATTVENVTVSWPSGLRESFADLAAGKQHVLVEGSGKPLGAPEPPPAALFRYSASLEAAGSAEKQFDDFAREPLLPSSLSRLGPGLAFADLNSDGWDDFYLARPREVGGSVFIHTGAVKPDGEVDFFNRISSCFEGNAASEEMAPLFFDADGDGDADLFVTSGSNEAPVGDAPYHDHLYLHAGNGRFTAAPDHSLPDLRHSSSVACAADFDRDGDLDLFVGTRAVPGAYPTSAPSHLLLNDGSGKFTALPMEAGLVTSALWSDADADGWPDLLVTREWGPVTLYHNNKGTLDNGTALTESGWWNSIDGRDLDNDGDIDYVAGNFGLNTKYHPSKEHPSRIYYGDFEGTGNPQIVEAKVGDHTLLPVRGKSCSQNAMPTLRGKFPTFHSFASATLEEIYTAPKLETALRLEATELRSGILWNEGGGKFRFAPLPRLAQAAPVFGLALTDIDADGWCDIYLAGNFFGPQAETGRMDGGLSLLLRGTGNGNFEPVPPAASGLIVPHDARALAVTDLNHDDRPDFVLTVNAGPVLTFLNETQSLAPLKVTAPLGTRITVAGQAAEIRAGGGYLSQSSNILFFARANSLIAHWPDGTTTEHAVPDETNAITVENAE